jgi:hypothetical protein
VEAATASASKSRTPPPPPPGCSAAPPLALPCFRGLRRTGSSRLEGGLAVEEGGGVWLIENSAEGNPGCGGDGHGRGGGAGAAGEGEEVRGLRRPETEAGPCEHHRAAGQGVPAAEDLVRFASRRIFLDLKRNIENLEKNGVTSMRSMVNLGSEVYAQAEVPDTRHIFVDIGLGFHVEFTWQEALQFISVRESRLAR